MNNISRSNHCVISTCIMAAVMLITGCSVDKNIEVNETTSSTSISSQETQNTTETTVTSTPTPTPVVYDFTWTNKDSEVFADSFEQIVGKNMRGYIICFGFTDELNEILTNYVNNNYSSNYESIPFSKVSYFHTYIVNKEFGYRTGRYSLDEFYYFCLDSNKAHHGPFVNKLLMSYLYHNQLPLGARIPFENLKSLEIEDFYTFSGVDYILDNGYMQLGNYDSSYEYSNYELLAYLEAYNTQMYRLCNDERIKNLDILTDDPEFPQAAEAREIYNGFLREYYGFNNCPQFGELITREQYIQIFGEEPLDLSYIPGAIYDPSLDNGNAVPTVKPTENQKAIDENLIGEWSVYVDYIGFTYIYEFNEDNTGTYTTIHNIYDPEDAEWKEQVASSDFTYTANSGFLTIEYASGNNVSYGYSISDDYLSMNKMEFERT